MFKWFKRKPKVKYAAEEDLTDLMREVLKMSETVAHIAKDETYLVFHYREHLRILHGLPVPYSPPPPDCDPLEQMWNREVK